MKKSIVILIIFSLLSATMFSAYTYEENNLYYYDSFEDGVTWAKISTSIEDEIFEQSDAYASLGNHSLRIWDNSDKKQSGARSGLKKMEPYYAYTLTVDAKLMSGNADLIFRTYDQEKAEVERKTVALDDEGWKTYSIDIDGWENVKYFEVLIQSTVSNIGELYIDNVKVTKGERLYIPNDEVSIAALNSAVAGDTFVIPDGIYENIKIDITCKGNLEAPITLKAKNPGKAIFTGISSFNIKGQCIILSDLLFNECTNTNPEYIVYFSVGSSDSQLKNCAFINCNPAIISPNTQLDQVYIRGERHKVTNCFFNYKSSIGRMVNIENKLNSDNSHTPGYHTVENCYFGNFTSYTQNEAFNGMKNPNGFEVIKIGSSDTSMYSSNSVVTGCFFEKCNGEDELITVKSSENTISYNNFYRSSAAVHLRQGHSSTVKGNLFINDIERINIELLRSSGLRIYDRNHVVSNNYFYNQPENTGAIFLDSATENGTVEQYAPIVDINVFNNTLIGADAGIVAGMYYKNSDGVEIRKVPPQGNVSNNALISYKGTLPIIYNGDTDELKHALIFNNNYAYGKELGYTGELPSGIKNQQFDVLAADGFIIPSNGTGADINELKKAPASPFDVIPDWVKESYYDTGIYTFEAAQYDLLNDKNAHLNDLVWFKAAHSIENGQGSITVYKNDIPQAENPITVSNNPTLRFTATPSDGYLFAAWYVNGIKITEDNRDMLDVTITDNNELIIDNHIRDIEISAGFSEIPRIPDTIEAGISSIQGKDITVINHEGITTTVTGHYKLAATKVPLVENIPVLEWGFLISKDLLNYDIKAKSLTPLNQSGAYGMLIYNLVPDTQYGIKAYVIYEDYNKNQVMITGTEEIFTITK